MRRIICLLTALVLCLSIAAPVFAVENGGFVPSITYKPNPEIVPVEDETGGEYVGVIRDAAGEIVSYVEPGCLLITPVAHIWDEEEEVPAEVERLLTFVYEELNEGNMEIPYEKLNAELDENVNLVIRDLFDIRWYCEEHPEMLAPEGVTLDITFDLGIMPDTEVYVMTYDEEADDWDPIVKTVNNGDGTVTCTFEHFCAVSFSVPMAATPVPTDDAPSFDLWPWILLLIVAVIGIIIVVIVKKNKKQEA